MMVLGVFHLSSVLAQTIQSEKQSFRVVPLTQGLQYPWSVAFLPDGRLLITERAGRLRIVQKDFTLDPKPVSGLPDIIASGQGGLFDVVLHPQYSKNLVGHQMTNVQVLFSMEPKTRSNHHFGGRIVFDEAGYVYLTLGDRGEMARAQQLDDHAGSIIRLHDDGKVPKDNPFVNRAGAKPEKFTLGNRNVQGVAIHPKTGEVWTHEHGPQGGDEINIIKPARNYGWPIITYGVNYGFGTKIGEGTTKAGLEQPLYVWVPSIAPSGMAFYKGNVFTNWNNHLFVGALRAETLVRLELQGDKVVHEERLLQGSIGRIRDVRVGPDQYIYLLTDERAGGLYRLEPSK